MTPTEFFTWQLVVASGCMFAIVVGGFLAYVVCHVRELWRAGDEPMTYEPTSEVDDPQRFDPMRWQVRRAVALRSKSELGAYL